MMDFSQLRQAVYAAEDRFAARAEEVSGWLYQHPELGEEEFESCAYLTRQAEALGFRIEQPYGGLETGFRAEYGDPTGPRVAFLAEYDALPGYGCKSPNGTGNGHACGHNWIGASTLAAAAALKELYDEGLFNGLIVWMGTPAEETTGGKIDFQKAGCFDDLDAIYQFHLEGDEGNSVDTAALACTDLTYIFRGKASHASNNPEDGVNALDACTLTFAGVNALRQHVRCDTRIHGIIKEGGVACNTVPDHCVMQYFVRAGQKDYLENVIERVNNCAKGAALMTGCEVEIQRCRNTFWDLKNQPLMMNRMMDALGEFGISDFRHGDIYHCGSTDIGNASYCAPTCYCTLAVEGKGNPHEAIFLDRVDSDNAHHLLHIAAKVMAACALEVYCDPDYLAALRQVKRELQTQND